MGEGGVERAVVEVQEGVEGAVVEGQEGVDGAVVKCQEGFLIFYHLFTKDHQYLPQC